MEIADTLEQAFEWRTTFNELKTVKPLIQAIELEHSQMSLELETYLAQKLSTLTNATQQRLKDLTYAHAEICPSYMSRVTYEQLKQEINYRSKTGQELYNIISQDVEQNEAFKFKWMLLAAQKGSVDAQAFLGWCYYEGEYGCAENRVQSFYWYTKAANQKNLEAQYLLDTIFVEQNVPKTDDEAKNRFKIAMESYINASFKNQDQNEDKSQLEFTIGNCYHRGYGVEVDKKQAIHFYKVAAAGGNTKAQYMLGTTKSGDDDPDIKPLAIKYLRELAEKGDPDAQERLSQALVDIDIKESIKWNLLAAEQDEPYAMYNLARGYENVHEKTKEAFDLFVKSANKGNLSSCYALGRYARLNQKNIWDPYCSKQEQMNWVTWAANRGHLTSQVILGIYWATQGDLLKSRDWFFKASNRKYKHSWYCIGLYYTAGVRKDMVKAIQWLTLAATHDVSEAQFQLGKHYYDGFYGLDNKFMLDKKQGLEWIRKAAKLDLLLAKQWMELQK